MIPLTDRIRIHAAAHLNWEHAFYQANRQAAAEAPGSAPWFTAREDERQAGRWAEEIFQELQAMRLREGAGELNHE